MADAGKGDVDFSWRMAVPVGRRAKPWADCSVRESAWSFEAKFLESGSKPRMDCRRSSETGCRVANVPDGPDGLRQKVPGTVCTAAASEQ